VVKYDGTNGTTGAEAGAVTATAVEDEAEEGTATVGTAEGSILAAVITGTPESAFGLIAPIPIKG
jgi:hypothetical protein